jgi:two-component system sensor histidine kinase RegB
MDPALTATPLRVPPGLRHALVNLLNNAAEASALNDSHDIALTLGVAAGWLQITVRDHGPGFADAPAALGQLGVSGKQSGLGLGLALAEATAERLNGELAADNAAGGGAEIRLRLPLAIIGDRP